MKTSLAPLRRNRPGILLPLAALALYLAPYAAQAQSDNPTDYVLIANKLVRFGRSSAVASGNVGVSASLTDGGGVLFADRQLITGDGTHLVADSAELRPPGSIYSLFSNDATLGAKVEVRVPCGSGACAFPAPILNPFPSAPVITAGVMPITVPTRKTLTLSPGEYGPLKVRSRATVVFTGGVYNFSEFKTGKTVRVLFTAPTTVNVAGRLQFGSLNVVGPIGPGAHPEDVLFQVAGDKVRIKPRTTVSARIWAPASLMLVGYSGLVKGQLVADTARLDRGVVLQSSFPIGPFEVRTNTPTLTPIPTNTPTYTATPTHTPLIPSTATATSTPDDTQTFTPVPPTNTPLPTNTPAPTDTPVPTNTPLPTDTPSPTNTPVPTDTALPNDTPVPTATATEVFTATPTNTAVFTATATPTFTVTPTSTFTATAIPTATATNTSTTVPTATPTLGQAVQPILECVIHTGPAAYTAYFGYRNDNPTTINIPKGANNGFSPAPQDRGQPASFTPGRTSLWPNAAFSVAFDGSNLTWTVIGPDGATRSVTANSSSTPCSERVYLEKKWYDEDGNLLGSPPVNLPANYSLTATSSLGTATCAYSAGSLSCTYSNPGLDNQGLWVPSGASYSVSETNLPSNFSAVAGTGSFTAQVPGGYCTNPYLGDAKKCLHTVKNIATSGCSGAVSLETSGFEQVNYITQILAGTVTQIGGSAPGASMTNAASFQGTPGTQSGVSVAIPGYLFASSAPASNLSGSSEPGNVAAVILGAPTDITFTLPGSGGPDGTDGDGSLVMENSGNFVTLGFGSTICAGSCSQRSLILFTDTAGSGTALIQLLSGGSPVASMTATFAGGAVESAFGGAAFNINGITFDQVKISRQSGTVEVDAVAVKNASCGGGQQIVAVCGDDTRDVGEECDDGNSENADGCSSDCRNEYDALAGARYCTLSQGGWKGPNGGAFLSRAPELLPATIGGPDASTTIHASAALKAYLPRGGTPNKLLPGERHFSSAADVVDDGAGVLGGQTMALTLALGLSASGEVFENLGAQALPSQPFCTQALLPGVDGWIGTADDELDTGADINGPYSFPASVAGVDNDVSDLLTMANQYLRGASAGPSISEINSALNTVNLAFDGCRQVVPCN